MTEEGEDHLARKRQTCSQQNVQVSAKNEIIRKYFPDLQWRHSSAEKAGTADSIGEKQRDHQACYADLREAFTNKLLKM